MGSKLLEPIGGAAMSAPRREDPPSAEPSGTVQLDSGDLASVVLSIYALRGALDQFAADLVRAIRRSEP